MPVIVVASLDLMTWMVAIASSNVIPSFLSGEYFGSAMSSNQIFSWPFFDLRSLTRELHTVHPPSYRYLSSQFSG